MEGGREEGRKAEREEGREGEEAMKYFSYKKYKPKLVPTTPVQLGGR